MTSEVNISNFDKEVLEESLPVLVDFWAPWCGPCKMMTPVLEEAQKKYTGKIKIVKLNTDDNQEIASRYQITGIPTLIFFKNGQIRDQIIGFTPQHALFEKIDSVLT